jgi:hypothetical protein
MLPLRKPFLAELIDELAALLGLQALRKGLLLLRRRGCRKLRPARIEINTHSELSLEKFVKVCDLQIWVESCVPRVPCFADFCEKKPLFFCLFFGQRHAACIGRNERDDDGKLLCVRQ